MAEAAEGSDRKKRREDALKGSVFGALLALLLAVLLLLLLQRCAATAGAPPASGESGAAQQQEEVYLPPPGKAETGGETGILVSPPKPVVRGGKAVMLIQNASPTAHYAEVRANNQDGELLYRSSRPLAPGERVRVTVAVPPGVDVVSVRLLVPKVAVMVEPAIQLRLER